MLEANEINPNVSEDKLTMEADDEDDDSKVNKTSEGEKILKGLTMEVSLILFYALKFHHDSSPANINNMPLANAYIAISYWQDS